MNGGTLCSSGDNGTMGRVRSGMPPMNALRCCARVRNTIIVWALCEVLGKVFCSLSDNSLSCESSEYGSEMQCCGKRSADPEMQYPLGLGTK
jgi:hypothetical protein